MLPRFPGVAWGACLLVLFARPVRGQPRMACAVAWSPDGQTLASGGLDGRVRLWGAATGKELRPEPGHQQAVTHVGWSADGQALATAGRDDTLRLWRAAGGKELRRQDGLAACGRLLAFAPDGRTVAACQAGGRVGGCSLASGAWGWELPALNAAEAVTCLALLPDGKLVTGHRDGQRSPEVRRRVRDLLDGLENAKRPGAAPAPQQQRGIRAVEVLERLGGPDARAVLANLAEGASQARLPREARTALRRLRGMEKSS